MMTCRKKKASRTKNKTSIEEINELLGDEVSKEITEIIKLKRQGVSTLMIYSSVGISRATYYRRCAQLKKILSADATEANDMVFAEIGEAMAFYKDIRITAMKRMTVAADPKDRATNSTLALKAEKQLIRFLNSIGFFDEVKASRQAKAREIQYAYANKDLVQTNLHLLDENYRLRQNLAAVRNGKPEPHFGNELMDWDDMMEKLHTEKAAILRQTGETFETPKDDFNYLIQ